MTALKIPLAEVVADASAQMRVAGIDPAIVDDYAEDMRSGASFPAIQVFHDGQGYYVADGFHRVEAARKVNGATILAEVHQGGLRDAILAAAGANASHGIRATRADRRHAVERLLNDPEWARWSDREIAKVCQVDHKTVGKIRRELTGEFPSDRSVAYRNRHGNTAAMKVKATERVPVLDRVLAKVSTEALIAECRRRGIEVPDV